MSPGSQFDHSAAQAAFSPAHLMKLFPGMPQSPMSSVSMSAPTPGSSSPPLGPGHNIFRGSGLQHSSYPGEFSNYGPMYTSYYAKTAQAMAAQANCPTARTSPYQRGGGSLQGAMAHYPAHPGAPPSCYQNFAGAGSTYPRANYDYAANTPR